MQLSLQGKSSPAFMCSSLPGLWRVPSPAGSHRGAGGSPGTATAGTATPGTALPWPALTAPFKPGLKHRPVTIQRVWGLCAAPGVPFEKLFNVQIMSTKLSKGMLWSK